LKNKQAVSVDSTMLGEDPPKKIAIRITKKKPSTGEKNEYLAARDPGVFANSFVWEKKRKTRFRRSLGPCGKEEFGKKGSYRGKLENFDSKKVVL